MLISSHARSETVLPSNWGKDVSDPNQQYYYNEATGETAWVPPPGSTGGSSGVAAVGIAAAGGSELALDSGHGRNETVLPPNWSKDQDVNTGDKYYYNSATEEMAWEAPEGSTGGSTGL